MKDKIDFRLENKTKQLLELAAQLNDMTLSGYINHLVEQSREKIIDDIAFGLASEKLIGILFDEEDRKELTAIAKRRITLDFAEENFGNEDFYFKIQSDFKKVFTDYIKSKDD
jgi:uncharacterized protein (DUF1778 family)